MSGVHVSFMKRKVILPNTEAKCLENDIGETSNYDIGNITTCEWLQKRVGERKVKDEGKQKALNVSGNQ